MLRATEILTDLAELFRNVQEKVQKEGAGEEGSLLPCTTADDEIVAWFMNIFVRYYFENCKTSLEKPFWLKSGIGETTLPGLLCTRLGVFGGSCPLLSLGDTRYGLLSSARMRGRGIHNR